MRKIVLVPVLAAAFGLGALVSSIDRHAGGGGAAPPAEAFSSTVFASGGCDGHGAPPACTTCVRGGCTYVCVGYASCSVTYENREAPVCIAQGRCASGQYQWGGFGWLDSYLSGAGFLY